MIGDIARAAARTAALDCDDGHACTVDTCEPLVGCVHTANPRTCRSAQASRLLVGDHADTKMAWKWTGPSAGPGGFGTPTDTTAYTFCVFAGSVNALVAEADVPPHAHKWRARGSQGFTYMDPTGAADGIRKIMLAGSGGHTSKASVQGRGGALSIAAPPFSTPVTAQLTNSSTDVC